MSEGLPRDAQELGGFLEGLRFDAPPAPAREAELLASLPEEGADTMVVRSLRLPLETDLAVAAAAKTAGVTKTAWIRQAIEMALTMQADDDQMISRADALRALTLLRPARHVA